MHKIVKQTLLRLGGYSLARELNKRIEQREVFRRISEFRRTGNCALPDMLVLEPTQRCNLRCKMCYQDREKLIHGTELSLEQFIAFFEKNPQFKKITLIGGEIYVRPDMSELIRYLDRSRNLVVCTNGTLLQENDLQTLASCKHILSVCISLDGPEKVHDNIRGVSGTHQRVIETIKAISPHVPVTVNCVIQNENLDVMEHVVRVSAESGVRKVKLELERLMSCERIENTLQRTATAEQDIGVSSEGRMRSYSKQVMKQRVSECIRLGKQLGIYVFLDPDYLIDDLDACYNGTLRNDKPNCGCYSFRTAVVAPDGSLIHCFSLRTHYGSILDSPFEEVWNSKAANEYREQLLNNNLTPLCENCPFIVPRI